MDRIFNQFVCFLGGLRTLARQAADLVGYHGKALTGRTCPGCLYRRIQCQNIGLESDVVNGLDDTTNGSGLDADVLHGLAHGCHLGIALFQLILDLFQELPGLNGFLCFFRHLPRQLLHGRGQFLHGRRLLRGTLGKGLGAVGNLIRTSVDLVRRLGNGGQSYGQGVADVEQCILNLGKLPYIILMQVEHKIARSNLIKHSGNFINIKDVLFQAFHNPGHIRTKLSDFIPAMGVYRHIQLPVG